MYATPHISLSSTVVFGVVCIWLWVPSRPPRCNPFLAGRPPPGTAMQGTTARGNSRTEGNPKKWWFIKENLNLKWMKTSIDSNDIKWYEAVDSFRIWPAKLAVVGLIWGNMFQETAVFFIFYVRKPQFISEDLFVMFTCIFQETIIFQASSFHQLWIFSNQSSCLPVWPECIVRENTKQ